MNVGIGQRLCGLVSKLLTVHGSFIEIRGIADESAAAIKESKESRCHLFDLLMLTGFS